MKKRHLLAFHTCLVSLSQSVLFESEPLFFFLGSSFSEWWQLRARPCAKRFDPCYEMIHHVIRLSGVIRQTINAPPFRAFQGMKWQACFCNPPSVALSKCSENSAAAPTVPLVLLYYALLRPAGACYLLPCHNQEPHELHYAFQNATHRDLTCCAKCKVVQRPS